MRAQRRPRRRVGQAGHDTVGGPVQPRHDGGPGDVGGGHGQGVDVPGGSGAELVGGVVLVAEPGGRRAGGVVAGQDLFEDLGGGGRVDQVGVDHGVRVAVPGGLQVDVVGVPAAGEHRVQLLTGLAAAGDAVHGVGRDPLRGMHRGGVAELDRFRHVAGRQADPVAVPEVLDGQGGVVVDGQDGPPVPVLHPVAGRDPHRPQVLPGDHQVPALARFPSASADLRARVGIGTGGGEAVGAGPLVQVGDQVPGRGEHHRVQAAAPVGQPGGEGVVGDGGQVADVDPVLVEVEPEGLRPAVAQGEGGGGLGRVGEPHQLAQVDRAVGGGDVPQDAAGADRGQLLVIADQPDAAPSGEDVADGRCPGTGCRPSRPRRR